MGKGRRIAWICGLVCGMLGIVFAFPVVADDAALSPAAQGAVQLMTGEPVFVQNLGQWDDPSIHYALAGTGANVGLTDQGPSFQLFRPVETSASNPASEDNGVGGLVREMPSPAEMQGFSMVFDGAAKTAPVGRNQSETTFNYTLGAPKQHRQGVPSFSEVWYEELYPGIDLEVVGKRGAVKYNFHVAPGADWRAIRMRYEEIQGLTLLPDGGLQVLVRDGWAPLTDAAPYIYQEVDGVKHPVTGAFRLLGDDVCSFEITGVYNPALALVIDPEVAWGTYLGGMVGENGRGIAVDSAGNILVAGNTGTPGWVSGGYDTSYCDATDAFVAKLSPTGSHVWSSYLGGSDDDYGFGIAVDAADHVLVVGSTKSSDQAG